MTAYIELLKDPRWQKKRLEIMERDDWKCTMCEDEGRTLHVHHCYYERDKMPWEYPSRSLVTLCEDCHFFETKNLKNDKKTMIDALSMHGLNGFDYDALGSSAYDAHQHAVNTGDERYFLASNDIDLICFFIKSPEARGVLNQEYERFILERRKKIKRPKEGGRDWK